MLYEAFLYLICSLSVDRILSLNVNAADSALKNADLSAIAAGLDNAGLVLDADDLADDAADSGDLVANLEAVSHVSNLFLLLLLGTNAEEIENDYDNNEHTNGDKSASELTVCESGKCKNIEHFDIPFWELIFYILIILQPNHLIVNIVFVNFLHSKAILLDFLPDNRKNIPVFCRPSKKIPFTYCNFINNVIQYYNV